MTDTITVPTRPELIDNTVTAYVDLVESLGGFHEVEAKIGPVLTERLYRACLDQAVSTTRNRGIDVKQYGYLKRPPTYRERPLGSLYLRLRQWHQSGGVLDGLFMASMDCDLLVHNAIAAHDDKEFSIDQVSEYRRQAVTDAATPELRRRLLDRYAADHARSKRTGREMLGEYVADVAAYETGANLCEALQAPLLLAQAKHGTPALNAWSRALSGAR